MPAACCRPTCATRRVTWTKCWPGCDGGYAHRHPPREGGLLGLRVVRACRTDGPLRYGRRVGTDARTSSWPAVLMSGVLCGRGWPANVRAWRRHRLPSDGHPAGVRDPDVLAWGDPRSAVVTLGYALACIHRSAIIPHGYLPRLLENLQRVGLAQHRSVGNPLDCCWPIRRGPHQWPLPAPVNRSRGEPDMTVRIRGPQRFAKPAAPIGMHEACRGPVSFGRTYPLLIGARPYRRPWNRS